MTAVKNIYLCIDGSGSTRQDTLYKPYIKSTIEKILKDNPSITPVVYRWDTTCSRIRSWEFVLHDQLFGGTDPEPMIETIIKEGYHTENATIHIFTDGDIKDDEIDQCNNIVSKHIDEWTANLVVHAVGDRSNSSIPTAFNGIKNFTMIDKDKQSHTIDTTLPVEEYIDQVKKGNVAAFSAFVLLQKKRDVSILSDIKKQINDYLESEIKKDAVINNDYSDIVLTPAFRNEIKKREVKHPEWHSIMTSVLDSTSKKIFIKSQDLPSSIIKLEATIVDDDTEHIVDCITLQNVDRNSFYQFHLTFAKDSDSLTACDFPKWSTADFAKYHDCNVVTELCVSEVVDRGVISKANSHIMSYALCTPTPQSVKHNNYQLLKMFTNSNKHHVSFDIDQLLMWTYLNLKKREQQSDMPFILKSMKEELMYRLKTNVILDITCPIMVPKYVYYWYHINAKYITVSDVIMEIFKELDIKVEWPEKLDFYMDLKHVTTFMNKHRELSIHYINAMYYEVCGMIDKQVICIDRKDTGVSSKANERLSDIFTVYMKQCKDKTPIHWLRLMYSVIKYNVPKDNVPKDKSETIHRTLNFKLPEGYNNLGNFSDTQWNCDPTIPTEYHQTLTESDHTCISKIYTNKQFMSLGRYMTEFCKKHKNTYFSGYNNNQQPAPSLDDFRAYILECVIYRPRVTVIVDGKIRSFAHPIMRLEKGFMAATEAIYNTSAFAKQ